MDKEDFYTVLHIESSAGQEAIKAAYKRLALLYHPDRCDHPEATEQMQMLNAAYEVLANPEKRAEYDRAREITKPLAIVKVEPEVEHQARDVAEKGLYTDPRLNGWLREQLKYMSLLVLLTLLLFLYSLYANQVNAAFILLPVSLAVYIIISIILRIKNPVT